MSFLIGPSVSCIKLWGRKNVIPKLAKRFFVYGQLMEKKAKFRKELSERMEDEAEVKRIIKTGIDSKALQRLAKLKEDIEKCDNSKKMWDVMNTGSELLASLPVKEVINIYKMALDKSGNIMKDADLVCDILQIGQQRHDLYQRKDLYEEVIQVLIGLGRMDLALRYFEQMKHLYISHNHKSLGPTIALYNRMLNACMQVDMMQQCVQLYEEMYNVFGIRPNVDTYKIMLHVTQRLRRRTAFFQFYHVLESRLFPVDHTENENANGRTLLLRTTEQYELLDALLQMYGQTHEIDNMLAAMDKFYGNGNDNSSGVDTMVEYNFKHVFVIANTYLQLNRPNEALDWLSKPLQQRCNEETTAKILTLKTLCFLQLHRCDDIAAIKANDQWLLDRVHWSHKCTCRHILYHAWLDVYLYEHRHTHWKISIPFFDTLIQEFAMSQDGTLDDVNIDINECRQNLFWGCDISLLLSSSSLQTNQYTTDASVSQIRDTKSSQKTWYLDISNANELEIRFLLRYIFAFQRNKWLQHFHIGATCSVTLYGGLDTTFDDNTNAICKDLIVLDELKQWKVIENMPANEKNEGENNDNLIIRKTNDFAGHKVWVIQDHFIQCFLKLFQNEDLSFAPDHIVCLSSK
ncbi:hypothetical protein RFI_23144 [Reticulomyxa filosa]|uniref:Pentacotripeptide-repeat region of PRORP domain-containing protein n=1 Tax=Reticulomyxa filosa TaxID=46433 RepID=X6MJN1_RETFI|nr:hypothetical protein RFI_23144 [Reticulomyxa filosa]|eukprot:ETO14223.1 hypothetical protein RFI_23144 [Reticulomyxa filosa]